MKRMHIILGAAFALLLAGAGGIWLQRPESRLVGDNEPRERPPTVSAEAMTAAQQRNVSLKAKIKSLGAAQDRNAYGDKSAPGAQDNLFEEILEEYDGIDFAKTPVLPDFDDILVYVLSGGEPDVLQKFVDNADAPSSQKVLAKGVLSFVNGEGKESLEQLSSVQLMALSPQLIGPMALARASLEAAADTETAMEFLDIARLSSPHTAVEEAAIRREVLLLLRRNDIRRGLMLMADYLGRYSKSAFRPGFVAEFAEALVENDKSDGRDNVAEFYEAIEALESEVQSDVLLAVARGFLGKGKLEAVKSIASDCLKSATVSEQAKTRAKLYLAAADAPSVRAETSASTLAELSRTGPDLSKEDTEIRRAAVEIANSVIAVAGGQFKSVPEQVRAGTSNTKSDSVDDGFDKSFNSTVDRASAVLNELVLTSRDVP